MSFDTASILVSFVLGSIGFVGFVYGKRQSRLPHMVAGAILMIFPFFVPSALVMGLIGAGIVGLWAGLVYLGA